MIANSDHVWLGLSSIDRPNGNFRCVGDIGWDASFFGQGVQGCHAFLGADISQNIAYDNMRVASIFFHGLFEQRQ